MSRHAAALALVWMLCVAYLGLRADHGWIPHDEGLLGQTAERVLHGELPHRDFDDTYTGGLAVLHAAAFRALGVKLGTLRLVLLLFCCAFVPVLYGIAARVTPPIVAALVTLTCVAWSVPNYFAGLPSWYNLFFATFGTAALLRHIDTGRDRWLVLAGICGGLGLLVKTIGLYYIGAVLLYLLYYEQTLRSRNDSDRDARPGGLAVVVVPALIVFVTATSVLVSFYGGLMATLQFVVPPAALCALLAWRELRCASPEVLARLRTLARLLVPFVAGVAVPCAAFVLPFAWTGSVGRLLYGAFVLPQQRFEFAVFSLPPAWTLVAVLPLALLLFAPLRRPRGLSPRSERTLLVAMAVLLAVVIAWGGDAHVYRAVWYSVRPAIVIAALSGAAVLVLNGAALPVQQRLQLFLLLAMATLINLVQFPYAFGIYWCYTAPLILLAIVYVVASQPSAPTRVHLGLLVFYCLFALVWLNRGFVRDIGGRFTRLEQSTPLRIDRGGLAVSAPEADVYERLVAEIQSHSADGDFIYATPDCPEVYFLANRRNPTRTFYDFFDADYGSDPTLRRGRILGLLDERHVDVVVIHWQPEFSRTFDPDLVAGLVQRYPNKANIHVEAFPGPVSFTVRWRKG